MILNKNINPERDVYNLGASVIQILVSSKSIRFGLLDTYQELLKKEKISLQLFLFTLDWLFILGVIKRTTNGDFEKCF